MWQCEICGGGRYQAGRGRRSGNRGNVERQGIRKIQGEIYQKQDCSISAELCYSRTCHKNMVAQERWSLVTGSVALKCGIFCQKFVILQDRCTVYHGSGSSRQVSLYVKFQNFTFINKSLEIFLSRYLGHILCDFVS